MRKAEKTRKAAYRMLSVPFGLFYLLQREVRSSDLAPGADLAFHRTCWQSHELQIMLLSRKGCHQRCLLSVQIPVLEPIPSDWYSHCSELLEFQWAPSLPDSPLGDPS